MSEPFTRNKFPNHGWMFRQPQTNWTNPMAMVGFDASVNAIIAHRRANKAITAKHQLPTDYDTVANELERYTKLRLGIPLPAPPSFFWQSSSHLPSRVVAAAADIKRAAEGTAVIIDWLGSGADPVDQKLAEKRASICVSCPKNVSPKWYIQSAGGVLKSTIETWQRLKNSTFEFKTQQGDDLKACDVCLCLMRLKVFVPLKHIVSKTPPEIMQQFPENCWIKNRDQ